jgi:predicted PurR-regulated permease PerM
MVQEAITQAINEVFLSLVKISVFHALWTWLTLTVLGVRIVYISTFLTLLFVIFPVIGIPPSTIIIIIILLIY